MSIEPARSLALRIGGFVAPRIGARLWLRDYPSSAPGDVGHVLLGLDHGGIYRALGVVSDPGERGSATVVGMRQGVPALVAFEGDSSAEVARVASAIAEHVGSGAFDAVALNALDAAFGTLDVLGRLVNVPDSRFAVTLFGLCETDRTSGASIGLLGRHEWPDVASFSQRARGVEVCVPAEKTLDAPHVHALDSPEALLDALPALVEEVRRAIAGRFPSA